MSYPICFPGETPGSYMPRKEAISRWSHLFFMPSLYGGVMWGAALTLYGARLVEWERNSAYATVIFLIVEAAFISSVVLFSPMYRSWLSAQRSTDGTQLRTSSPKGLIVLLHGIGFIGLAKYVIDFSEGFGGIEGFIIAFVSDSYLIRSAAKDTFSIGTQIGYLGWVAISLTVFEVWRYRLSCWWLLPAILQFAGNLLYVDRAKPLWILFTSLLVTLPVTQRLSVKRMLLPIAVAGMLGMLIFVGIAVLVGKVAEEGEYGSSTISAPVQNMAFYLTAGFPYFNRLFEEDTIKSYMPQRTVYPIVKMLSAFDSVENQPSQLNEFYYLPFETNVGTFLEPFYRDGGMAFVFLGIIIYSFALDLIGLSFLTAGTFWGAYAWANIAYVSFMSFFAPKIIEAPLWLFCFMGFLSLWFHRINFRGSKDSSRAPAVNLRNG